jgi:flagellar hook-length control protein FliK
MNTAAVLPSPAATARPSCDAVADACVETALLPLDGFALALLASLDADAQAAAEPQPALLAQPAQTPLPVALPVMPEMAGQSDSADSADTLEPLDPQSAFALAALGLLPAVVLPQAPAPVTPVTPVTPASTGDAAATAAGLALPVALVPLATPAAPTLNAAAAQPRQAAAAQAQAQPAMPPAAPDADTAPDAAQAIASARAAVAAAAPNAAPEGAANEPPAQTQHKTERAATAVELPAVAAPAAAPVRPAAALATAQPAVVLKGEATQWQPPLLQALGDRLQLQIAARSDQAVIRLEPPMLGQVEIAIRQQAGDLQVRIAATHDEVTRQIQQVGEQLRQSLAQRHGGEVSVQVAQPGAGGREGEPRGGAQQQGAHDGQQPARDEQQQARDQQQQQRRPGRGLNGGEAASFAADLAATKA